MWSRVVEGRELHFRLVGINNQNFLMADDETGSWWQQITGKCIRGPLMGKQLERIDSDEVTLAVWRGEHPESTVVRFLDQYRDKYAKSDWEDRIGKMPTVVAKVGDLSPRALVIGIERAGGATAFPLELLQRAKVVNASIGGEPVVVAVADDGRSVRSFLRRVDGRTLEFYRRDDGGLIDDAGGEWTFAGAGKDGRKLERVQNITEYWFDWQTYHPRTTVYRAGESIRRQ